MLSIGKLELLTRIGFAARGIIYALIGSLAIRLGRTEDAAGVLEYLDSGAGKAVLGAMAPGLLAYGVWRLSEAAIDTEGHGADAKGVAVRAGGAASGLIHLGLAYAAAKLAIGAGHGGDDHAEQGAATALTFPGGMVAIAVVAAILLVVAGYQFVKASKLGFLKHLDARAAGQAWIAWTGRLGYAARGAVFLIMAFSLWQAARHANAREAGSMDQALDALPTSLRIVVAAGLLLFGLFSLVEARHRRINDPKVLDRLKRAAAARI